MKTTRRFESGFKVCLGMLGLCLALCATNVQAGIITINGVGLGGDVPLIANGTPENGFAGQIFTNLNGSNIIAYCVDLFHGIGYTSYNNTTGAPSGYSNGGRAAWILENYGGNVGGNDQATALQLALWDVVHDGGDGLSTGTVILGGGASVTLRNAAQDIILASYGHSSSRATILYNNDLSSGARMQTLITYDASSPTPEPSTYGMMGVGLAVIVANWKRKRAQ